MENQELNIQETVEAPMDTSVPDTVQEVSSTGDLMDEVSALDPVETQEEESLSHKDTLLSEFLTEIEEESGPTDENLDSEKPEDLEEKKEENEEAEIVSEAPISYDDLSLPEEISFDEKEMSEFKNIMGSHSIPKEAAQKLMDMHTGAIASIQKKERESQWKIWNDTQKQWVEEAKADPEIGGSGHKTAMAIIAKLRDTYLKSNKDRKDFLDHLMATGSGNSPIFLKFLHRISKDLIESKPLNTSVSPPPDRGPSSQSRYDKLYDYGNSRKK